MHVGPPPVLVELRETQHPESHRLPGQHFAPVVPHAVQRALTDVAVEVAVEVDVEEQKMLGPLHALPAQQGALAPPQSVQMPALTV